MSWDAIPAEQQQGKLLGYYVYYKVKDSATEHNRSVGPDQFSYKITGLEWREYFVRVAGYTAVGVGKSTAVMSATPKEGGEESTDL